MKLRYLLIYIPSILWPFSTQAQKKIHVILSNSNRFYEQGLLGLSSVITQEPIIDYADIILEKSTDLISYYNNTNQSKPDLLITFGVKATSLAMDSKIQVPIIFSMIDNPKDFDLAQGQKCGVSSHISASMFFQTLSAINPQAKRVYAFYSDQSIKATEGIHLDLKYGVLYEPKQVTKNNYKDVLNQIKNSTDAFYIINDSLYDPEIFKEISDFAKQNSIILMTSYTSLLQAGATFSISPNYSELGIQTGKLVNAILNGDVTCKLGPIYSSEEPILSINEEYAIESKIELPAEIITRARNSGLLNKAVALLNRGKIKSAKNIFEYLRIRDPNNDSIGKYLAFISDRLTYSRTAKLFKKADKANLEQNYHKAIELYEKILEINPQSLKAKLKKQEAEHNFSLQEYEQGLKYLKQGNVLPAFQKFHSAIHYDSTNQNALSKIAEIRNQEAGKINDNINAGINFYKKRYY